MPGGVGPMTIAMLMANTLESARAFANTKLPPMELLELDLKVPVPKYVQRGKDAGWEAGSSPGGRRWAPCEQRH